MPSTTARLDPSRPFSRVDARRAGITVSELRGPGYRKLFYDCYVAATVEVTTQLLASAALSVAPPGSFASHLTAARLWGGVVPDDPDVHISVPGDASRSRRRGIKAHMASASAAVQVHRGILCSGPAQSFLDVASRVDLVALVVLGDSLVRADRVTPEALVAAADSWTGGGARLARRAARLVRAGAESPMETRTRLLLVLAGLPEPVVQQEVVSRDGLRRYRLDLGYPAWRVAAEYDGRHHAEDADQWGRDITRREDLDDLQLRIVVVRSKGIYVEPGATLDRMVNTLRGQGADVGIRSDEWRRHFPGRSSP